jgi:hypothetical protein
LRGRHSPDHYHDSRGEEDRYTVVDSLTERDVSEEEDCQHNTFDSVVVLEK